MRHKRLWIVLGGVAVLIAGHGIILYYFSSHAALSAAIVSGLLVLAVFKHLGLLRALYALLRKTRSW